MVKGGKDLALDSCEGLAAFLAARLVALEPAEIDRGLGEALSHVGGALGVDCAYIFLADGSTLSTSHAWCGLEEARAEGEELPPPKGGFERELLRGGPIVLWDVGSLPPEARTWLEERGIDSFLALPMQSNERLLGLVALGSMGRRKRWEREIIRTLRFAALLFAGALERARELVRRESERLRAERMASLGQLVAGVVHEINTPLGALKSNSEILYRSLSQLGRLCAGSEKTVIDIVDRAAVLERFNQDAIRRLVKLIDSLKRFTRLDRSEVDAVDVHELLDDALALLDYRLKDGVVVERDYQPLSRILCRPAELSHAIMNLLVEAIDGIERPGRISVRTGPAPGGIAVEIAGNAAFPKRGLPLARHVVEEHGGRIDAEGNAVRLVLPLNPPLAGRAQAGFPIQRAS